MGGPIRARARRSELRDGLDLALAGQDRVNTNLLHIRFQNYRHVLNMTNLWYCNLTNADNCSHIPLSVSIDTCVSNGIITEIC